MIYTVECSYADPASEAGWNAFYTLEKLPALISVRGFHTSQRLRALRAGCPVYLALHSVDSLAILQGQEYRLQGGGNFARWQQHITDWHRNLYAGLDRAPAVADGECLLISAVGPEPLMAQGLVPEQMHAVALDQRPAQRWLAKRPVLSAAELAQLPAGLDVYVPMAAQLTADANARDSESGLARPATEEGD